MIFDLSKKDQSFPALLLALQELSLDYECVNWTGDLVRVTVHDVDAAEAHELGMCHMGYLQAVTDMVDLFTTKKIVQP